MSFKAVLVEFEAGDASRARARLAARLAESFGAALIGFSALAIRPPFVVSGDIAVAETFSDDVEMMRAELDRRGERFRDAVRSDCANFEWRAELDYPVDALSRAARSADLVVIGRSRAAGDAYESLDPGEAVLNLGRPGLLVPDGVERLSGEHAIIGWKGTREARRAVRDALPLLRRAARVSVVGLCDADEADAARAGVNDVAEYLSRHEIKGEPRVDRSRGGSGAADLIALAQEAGADLLVTGAYGHSRLGEWAFGGMTRDLLARAPMCCLMSH